MNFSFMKNNNEVCNSKSKDNKLNEFFNKKKQTRKRGQKKYPHINQISSASFGTSSGISKSNTIFLILTSYIVFGYFIYQLLK